VSDTFEESKEVKETGGPGELQRGRTWDAGSLVPSHPAVLKGRTEIFGKYLLVAKIGEGGMP
jgi:hypothetical protein